MKKGPHSAFRYLSRCADIIEKEGPQSARSLVLRDHAFNSPTPRQLSQHLRKDSRFVLVGPKRARQWGLKDG